MKKVIYILATLIVTGTFLVVCAFGYFTYKSNKISADAKTYVDQSIVAIAAGWSKEAIVERSSPQMLLSMTTQGKEFDKLIVMFSKLGSLKRIVETTGGVKFGYDPKDGKYTIGDYTSEVQFEKSKAEIKMRIILQDGQWKVQAFRVESNYFLTHN